MPTARRPQMTAVIASDRSTSVGPSRDATTSDVTTAVPPISRARPEVLTASDAACAAS
jgi:hypothetical protein